MEGGTYLPRNTKLRGTETVTPPRGTPYSFSRSRFRGSLAMINDESKESF